MILQRYKKFNYISNLTHNKDIEYTNDGKFSTSGVSGFVGKILVSEKSKRESGKKRETKNEANNTLVYKMSSDVDFLIDHEAFVLSQLNQLKIPHFVKYYNLLESTDINILTKINKAKSKILLMEHLYSNYQPECLTFYNILKNYKDTGTKGRNMIASQILQILMALEISQNELSFTHYDLHMDNVLELECESNAVFLYQFQSGSASNDTFYVVPTFGYYPVLIDVGMSYVYNVNDRPMFSSIHNYINGSQSAIFDTFNDIHHLMISSFYYIEDCFEEYEKVSTKLKSIFSNIPVLRKRGWKQLKNNLVDSAVKKMKDEVKTFTSEIFDDQHDDLVGLLSALIKLPLKECEDESDKSDKDERKFNSSFDNFLKEIKYIHKLFSEQSDNDHLLLNIVKTVVNTIIKTEQKDEFKNLLITELKELSHIFSQELNTDKLQYIQFNYLYSDGNEIGIQLSDYFYKLVIENTSIIQKGYKNIEDKFEIYSPIDFFHYFYQNLTPHFKIDNDTIVYSFQNNIPTVRTCKKLDKDELYKINGSSYLTKGVMLNKYLSDNEKEN